MSELFLKLVNQSISASWLIAAILVLRLLLKRAPRWSQMLLWGIAAVRLLLPFSIESALSLLPSAETVSPSILLDPTPTVHTGIPAVNSVVNPALARSFTPSPAASANPLQIWTAILSCLWLLGMAVLFVYAAVSYTRLRWKMRTAVLLRENLYQSEHAASPFLLGIVQPKIYLPFDLDAQTMEYVISHEQAHLRRRDHWWKQLGFLLLTVYWFNPLVWLGYALFCRDIELACDESVIKTLDHNQRADYSQALLLCSVNHSAGCPLAFGEIGVKARIKSVLSYRKPTLRLSAATVAVSALLAVCFLTDPPQQTLNWARNLSASQIQSVELSVGTGKNLGQLTSLEIEKLVSFLHQATGRYEPHPEILDGGCDYFYLTLTDGTTHTVANIGNTYLLIDGDTYNAPYKWLSSMDEAFASLAVQNLQLMLDDVVRLSKKGSALTWDDFAAYRYIETGSGLHIRVYEIDAVYSLWIGGGSMDDAPMYIYLRKTDGENERRIDIREGGVEDFIAENAE